jgi:predicted RNA-binding Zn-ribbon protein involved in translation (DUF1610 family)
MNEFTGDYYQCNSCGHIWDYNDVCPNCGKQKVTTLNAIELKTAITCIHEEVFRLNSMLEKHGDR